MVLFLNDIGTGEVVLILMFILIFFGSKSIPGLARTMGRTLRQIKDASNDLQSEIKKSANEIKGDLNLKELIDDTKRDIQQPLDQYAADIEDVMKRTPINSQPKVKPTLPEAVDPTPAIESVEISEVPAIPEAPKVPKIDPIQPSSSQNGTPKASE